MAPTIARRARRRARTVGAAAALIAGLGTVGCAIDRLTSTNAVATFDVGTGLHTIDVGSLTREYVLHVPQRRPTTSSGMLLPYPLVLVLHGSSGSGGDIEATTNMDSVSEANRVVVAYPNAVAGAGGLFPTDWNAGNCCGAAGREDIDDVGFIKAVIAELSAKLPIDRRRIHIAGFSDGGRMAYRLACELSTQIAAIAVVSGSLKEDSCTPARPVAVIAIHGTDDPIVPYDDDADTPPPAAMTGVAATLPPSVQFWISENGCAGGSVAPYSARVEATTFPGCIGADVAFYSVTGGAHGWPVLLDPESDDPDETFSATALIAEFFRRHVLK
jgi:polyhydroxybutyrate depolymerase